MAGSDVLTGTFAGRYTIERELGSGATATVYLARDTQRGISVAVKLLRPELAQSVGAERFLREIRLNEKLHHPHIVPVLDSGEHDGRLYFVLPHMEDGSLRQLLQREKQLPIEQAVAIARTVAQALDYAHQQNLIHRDVKPENILFTSGQACLADFGIARAVERAMDESTTDTGMVRGTPAYMSPEQASGSKHYDGRSDQYSLACVLYEMLAGVPAFIGPTPEAVIAQRFQHLPRELRVYRPTVPHALESVIQRALAIAPADRFTSTAEFGAALDFAQRSSTAERRASGPTTGFSRPRRLAVAGTLGFVAIVAASALVAGSKGGWFSARIASDTSRYLVLPVEADSGLTPFQANDLVHRALTRWSGLTVVSPSLLTREAPDAFKEISDPDVAEVSQRFGAGRTIRIRIARSGGELRAYGQLYAAAPTPIHEASMGLALDLRDAQAAIERLVDRLVLRGDSLTGSMSLPAIQLFRAGNQAFLEFDLAAADSLLAQSAALDRNFDRAALWLAHVRLWRKQPPTTWRQFAEQASNGRGLTPHEKKLSVPLSLIAEQRLQDACRAYDDLIRANPRDYIAWYGSGECLRRDNVVLRDRTSPSGWAFRSSYHRAALAYARAFEIAPTVHSGFIPGAFSILRDLLFADRNHLRTGIGNAPDTTRFLAYPTWRGDSLAFVPYPRALVQQGKASTDPSLRAAALAHQRGAFARIARVWAATLPRNAGAKEAVAIALEMAGEPAAVDTLRTARTLAHDPLQRVHLAAEEVFVRISVWRRDAAQLRSAARFADSLLKDAPTHHPAIAATLAPVAALLGRCQQASMLASRGASPAFAALLGVPHFVYASAESLTTRYALGCPPASTREEQAFLETAVNSWGSPITRDDAEYVLLSRVASLAHPLDSARITRLADRSGDFMLRMQRALVSNDRDSARAMLLHRQQVRGPAGAVGISFDAVVVEARAWLALGDTVRAKQWLDPVLARMDWLESLWQSQVQAASLIRAAALRSEIAERQGDRETAHRWATLVAMMWSSADAPLRETAQELSSRSKR